MRALNVKRGDVVQAGQVLYVLDSDAEAFGSDAAQARSDGATAQADNLRKGRRPLELAALDEQLAQARAALANSTAALARQQTLVQQGFVAALRLDELTAARDRDTARVKELEAQRKLAGEAARSDEVAAAAAEARGAGADLALARWKQGQKQRSAPTDAAVHEVMYRVGSGSMLAHRWWPCCRHAASRCASSCRRTCWRVPTSAPNWHWLATAAHLA